MLAQSEAPQVEIIEIGAVKLNEKLEIVDDFCQFVRPKLHPEISPFCTKLTSIVHDIEDAPLCLTRPLSFLRNGWVLTTPVPC